VSTENRRTVINLFDNLEVFKEFKTRVSAEKLSKRKFHVGSRTVGAYVRESTTSAYGEYLRPGKKVYQVVLDAA
jgi:predicted peptidase